MNCYTYDECSLNKTESFTVTVTENMIEDFRNLSGDYNPLHNDEEYAKENNFRGKVVYGMLSASFLSTLAGMYLPGKYCLIQEVNVKFAKPVYVGDILTITGKVVEKNETFRILTLKVAIYNQMQELVVRGKMQVGLIGDGKIAEMEEK